MFLTRRLSIQSKLVLMLLAVSAGSIAVIASIGYSSGRAAVAQSVYDQLTGLRQSKMSSLLDRLHFIRGQATTLATSDTLVNAMREFRAGFAELEKKQIPPDWDKALEAYYRETFLPALAANVEGQPVLELPKSVPARYLQYQYCAKWPKIPYDDKGKIDSAHDGSAYDAAHQKYHHVFSKIARSFGYQDMMLVDAKSGDVVYIVDKSVEFGTSLIDGPESNTGVGELFRTMRRGKEKGTYMFSDFERYRPNLGLPAAFSASPIFDGNTMIGVLILQFPIDEINRTMTGDRKWEQEGLGKTGEVFLAGTDHLMRSQSRLLDQNPEEFYRELAAVRTPQKQVDAIRRAKSTILALELKSRAVDGGLAGHEGIVIDRDYRGARVVAAYAPVEVEGLTWAIVAKRDVDEALGPVHRFGREVLAYSVGIIVLVTLLALVMAHSFTHPIEQLAEGARQVGAGKIDVEVKVNSGDEFRELADAFNVMTRSLRAQAEQIEQKVRENEDLLLNILPGAVAARMKKGNGRVTESYSDVTVLFANVVGLSGADETMPADKAFNLLNDLVVAIDEAAERFGVEKVKTVDATYLAVCGLSEQRPDHTNRVVEFALELPKIVKRFNQEHGMNLGIEVGINTGPVVGGIVGRNKFIYDLWGETVRIARALSAGAETRVSVTREVHERVRDFYELEGPRDVEIKGKGSVAVWSVKGPAVPSTSA